MIEVDIPDWVTYPGERWRRISPAEAGLDPRRFDRLVADAHVEGAAWEGETHDGDDWGAVIPSPGPSWGWPSGMG